MVKRRKTWLATALLSCLLITPQISCANAVEDMARFCVSYAPSQNLSQPHLPTTVESRIHEFFIETLNLVSDYVIPLEGLIIKKYLKKGIVLCQYGTENDIYVVQDTSRGGDFQAIANVVASRIHKALATDEASKVDVKFVIANDRQGKTYLFGSARRWGTFKPLWGLGLRNIPVSPSNLSEEYAFWRYLGMPTADPSFIGVDTTEQKVVRVDFQTAFSWKYSEDITSACFNSTFFNVPQSLCDVEQVKESISRITSKPEVNRTLIECEKALGIMGITGVESFFDTIRSFLRKP